MSTLLVIALLIFMFVCCAKKRKDENTKVHVIGDSLHKVHGGGYSSRNALKGTASTEQNKRDITNAGSEMDDEL